MLVRAAVMAAVLVSVGPAPSAHAFEARVPDGYYGVSSPSLSVLARDQSPLLATQADAIQASGLDFVRSTVDWRGVEPLPPVGGLHVYNWGATDRLVAALARRRIEFLPNATGTPSWARALDISISCPAGVAIADVHAPSYGDFAGAIVRRYGRDGAFWREHPELPYEPVRRIEIWNEPNWTGSWCPGPQPERFANVAAAAADEVHRADPSAEVILGGLALIKEDLYFSGGGIRGMETGLFLERMVAARPELAQSLDQVAIHPYDPDPDVNLSLLGWTRARLRAAGLGEMPLAITEFGWHTQGSPEALSEEARARSYTSQVAELTRTDCRVAAIAAHEWFSPELDPNDPEHWFGIANPATGALHPAGAAYRDVVALFEGRGPTPAPRDTNDVCGGAAPDQDSDGVADAEDDYPLDPERSTGSGETPPAPPPAETPAREPRVGTDFFGVTSAYMPADPELRKQHYDSLGSLGLRNVRLTLEWDQVEPHDGSGPQRFHWTDPDRRMVAFAKHGVTASISPHHVPAWLPSAPGAADARFAEFMGALARRYGTDGVFWKENGHLDDSLAVRDYGVWTDANVDSKAWDGSSSAAEYAETYTTTRTALKTEDPNARAIVSLIDGGLGNDAAAFLHGMVQARPSLRGAIDGVYVTASGARTTAELESLVAQVRGALDSTGNASARLLIGFGAPTAGPGALSEQERAQFIADAARRLPRLDCGVDGAIVFAWSSAQADEANPWDWYGISAIADGAPSETAFAYRDVVRSFLGYGTDPAPESALHPCMREPLDRDGDGTPDPSDPAPLDPARSAPTASPPPAPTFGSRPPAWSGSTTAAFSYSATGATDYHCRLDGAPWRACGAQQSFSNLSEGSHRFEVRAIDRLGLLSQPTAHGWSVDTRAPETSITSGPSGTIPAEDATFSLVSDEPGGGFRCKLDGGEWQSCGGQMSYGGLSQGGHTFLAAAVDRAGNVDPAPAHRYFEVRTMPGTPVVQASNLTTQTPTFRFDAPHATSFECRFDQAAFGPCSGAREHSPARPLVKGAHRFEVRGRGPTGRFGPVAGWSFTVDDRDPPETTIASGPPSHHGGGVVEFELTSDEDGVSFWCQLDDEPWAPCDRTATFEGLEDGPHVFRALAVDPGQNVDASPAERSFTIDRTAPSITVERSAWKGLDRTPTIRFQAEDALGPVTTRCRVDGAQWVSCDSPFTTRRLRPGRHQVSIQAIDKAGNTALADVRLTVRRRSSR